MRLPTVCFRHVQVLSGCYFMHPSAFFPVYDVFFRLFLHVLVLPSSSSLCKISFGGSATCGLFTNMLLLLFRSLSITPFMWGSSRWSTLSGWSLSNGQNQLQLFWQTWHPVQSVGYPQWVISIQRTKPDGFIATSSSSYTTPISARCASFFSFVLLVACA